MNIKALIIVFSIFILSGFPQLKADNKRENKIKELNRKIEVSPQNKELYFITENNN